MTDIEIRKTILQYIFDHRHDYALRQVDINQLELIRGIDENRIRSNIIVLRDMGYVETMNSTFSTIRIMTPGINLVEKPTEFNTVFPIRYDIPQQIRILSDTIEEMLRGKYEGPLGQFRKAQNFLYEVNPPDYLNCVKESVGAVEAIARVLCNEPKKTLSELMPQLKANHLSHPAMAKIIDGIYGVRSDEPGVGHGAYETSAFGYSDAEFILNICASIMIYLYRKGNQMSDQLNENEAH